MSIHIVEMLSYGQLTIRDFEPVEQFPPYNAVMEALADMLDRAAGRWRARNWRQQRGG